MWRPTVGRDKLCHYQAQRRSGGNPVIVGAGKRASIRIGPGSSSSFGSRSQSPHSGSPASGDRCRRCRSRLRSREAEAGPGHRDIPDQVTATNDGGRPGRAIGIESADGAPGDHATPASVAVVHAG